jgi:HEPN domain-containing protein
MERNRGRISGFIFSSTICAELQARKINALVSNALDNNTVFLYGCRTIFGNLINGAPKRMEVLKKIYGIIELPDTIVCSSSVLGSSISICIGGVSGRLMFPSLPPLPSLPPSPDTYDDGKLIAPGDAIQWSETKWGKIAMYPQGVSYVYKMLLCFEVVAAELHSEGKKIHSNFEEWYGLWLNYVRLQTKQEKLPPVYTKTREEDLYLFFIDDELKSSKLYSDKLNTLNINLPSESSALTLNQIVRLSSLASANTPIEIELDFQLSAYRALGHGDYRKAIIESAVAAEIYITKEIAKVLETENCIDVPAVLKKHRMLGNLYAFAVLKEVEMPKIDWDFKMDLIDPRNEVIHDAKYANRKIAEKAISVVDKLLKFPEL